MMTRRAVVGAATCAAIGLILVASPGAAVAQPSCAELATNPAYGLVGNPQISGLTAALQPASAPDKPYCKVDFTFSGESGPSAGYLPGQSQQIRIRVGLPPNGVDMTDPAATGAVPWNGKNRDLGGGAYVGQVRPVTPSTNLGYVGTETDTGHATSGGGFALGGSFALNPDNTLNWGLIEDFAANGIHEQHVWGVKLAEAYYGMEPVRKYWMGCSQGGRQGHYQAQHFPQDFDGILAGSSGVNWDRFLTAELWPAVVMNQELGAPIAAAKLDAVTNAAITACDALDGILDGIIQDPRACRYSATAFVCQANGGPSSDPNCLTPPEAAAVAKIWDGPRDAKGNRVWYGLERGASLLGLAGSRPFGPTVSHFTYWIHQDPSFDWHTVTEASFVSDMLTSIEKFNDVIGTDDDLNKFRKAGGKMITYHGLSDQLIFSRGTYHYYNSVLQDDYEETQKFYRFFPYPGNGHCFDGGAAPLINEEDLFSALVNWVENSVAPDYIVATQPAAARTRKICMYPNVPVYNGSGSTDDQANFQCQQRKKDALIDELEIGKQFETSTKAVIGPGVD
jgi:Tannase and feruloyl esterase